MSINDLSGFNFGPILGPVGTAPPPSTAPQGILVRAWAESTPLDPGYWYWRDDGTDYPIHGDGPVIDPFPNPTGATLTGEESAGYRRGVNATVINLGYIPSSPPKSDPNCPFFTGEGAFGTKYSPCSIEIQKKIKEAINQVFNKDPWVSLLGQFPGLLECIRENCHNIYVDCAHYNRKEATYGDYLDFFDPNTPGGGRDFDPKKASRLIIGTDSFRDPKGLPAAIVAALVHACGGEEIEQEVISGLDGYSKKNIDLTDMRDEFAQHGGKTDRETGKLKYEGKYIWWIPKAGVVGIKGTDTILYIDELNLEPEERTWYQP